ncbi:MAG: S1/P1 Nuclease, partial [Flammeovirgaceae bacterium]|nr:S1/P1 Nuclease [Flammeovirgaceae bacterium]
MLKRLFLAIFLAIGCLFLCSWGFFAHQRINKLAVFTLPPELIGFYKKNIQFITEASVNPDRRRYFFVEEA